MEMLPNEQYPQLKAVLATAVDAIITINQQGIIASVNPATERLFGYTHREIVGQNVKMLMPPVYSAEHDSYLRRYCESGIARIIGIGREAVGLRKDGSTFPIHLAVSEFLDGSRRMFTGVVRDISDLKAVEQRLKESNADLERLVSERTRELREAQSELLRKERLAVLGQISGGIAHEIRNPLNAVKTSVYYLLHARNPTAEKTKEHLDRIDRQVTIMDNVVTALSDMARMPEPTRTPVRIPAIVESALSNVTRSDSISTVLELPEELPAVLADEHQLPLVFQNLVRNARDAMPNGGLLTIGAKMVGQEVRVHVKDTGVGISSDDLTRIFDAFYTTKSRGMGLGLSICQTILSKNGGRMEVTSVPGKGSEFAVYLPKALPLSDTLPQE